MGCSNIALNNLTAVFRCMGDWNNAQIIIGQCLQPGRMESMPNYKSQISKCKWNVTIPNYVWAVPVIFDCALS